MATVIEASTRLSRTLRPLHYNLTLAPKLGSGIFEGSVKIDVETYCKQEKIHLHTKYLDIKEVSVEKDKIPITISKFTELKDSEQLLICFDTVICEGNFQICVKFSGSLTRNIVGIYCSTLKDEGKMVASKFQPTYARQAFPCFDEPDFKATFDITLVKPVSYIALSNMNVLSTNIDQETNTEAVTFATSVPMSTYLACFVICDFDHKETTINSNGIGENFILRAFGQKNETHKIDYALSIGKRATEFYIKYYNVPFPLPKLDMIAIPDYVSGATEHWGLITYRETAFLVDEAKASASNKLSVANTIAHELAHMWFGNLVTMKWWDEIWLNEGFATYMQVKSLNAIEPSWTMLDQFLAKTLHPVLVTDAKLSSHPIVQTVETPDQITSIFDSISYNKGSSILRMLEGFIGEENFRQGVSDYLQKYKFGNTITQELLSCLEPYFKKDNTDLNLTYIMDSWTRQMGYPVLNVAQGESQETFILTQSRFLLDSTATYNNDSSFKYRWFIPVTYKTSRGLSTEILWFPDTKQQVSLILSPGETLLKINNNQIGYYRVNYTPLMWEALTEQLKNKSDKLSISDRANLLDDVFALAEAGHVPYKTAVNLLSYIPTEEDYVPWATASSITLKLANKLMNSSIADNLKIYQQRLVTAIYAKQSWERSDHLDLINRLLRTTVLSFALRSELPDAESRVKNLFSLWLTSRSTDTPIEIEPDMRDIVYKYGMRKASQSDWDKLWKIYLKEDDVQELTRLRTALAAPRNTSILEKYLTLAWDESNIRSQDYLNVLQAISDNPSGTILVWNYVKNNWPQLVDRFTLNNRYLGNMIPAITKFFNTENKLKEMEELFASYAEAGAGATARRSALETVRNNIRWSQESAPQLQLALAGHTSTLFNTNLGN